MTADELREHVLDERVAQGLPPTVPDDAPGLDVLAAVARNVELWCTCDIPSPVETDGAPPECAACRRVIA